MNNEIKINEIKNYIENFNDIEELFKDIHYFFEYVKSKPYVKKNQTLISVVDFKNNNRSKINKDNIYLDFLLIEKLEDETDIKILEFNKNIFTIFVIDLFKNLNSYENELLYLFINHKKEFFESV